VGYMFFLSRGYAAAMGPKPRVPPGGIDMGR